MRRDSAVATGTNLPPPTRIDPNILYFDKYLETRKYMENLLAHTFFVVNFLYCRLSEKHNKIVRKLVLSARKYFQSTLKVQRLHTLQLRP